MFLLWFENDDVFKLFSGDELLVRAFTSFFFI